MFHVCPIEISAFLMSIPLLGIGYRWLVSHCKKCCKTKHSPEESK